MSDLTIDLSKHMILAVDDDPDNLEVLRTTLEVLNKAVVCIAANCKEALLRLETFRPTLIISDISMPHVDGFGLLKLLRERPDTAKLPIIALTAHVMRGDRERILNAGFDGYIGKPFEVGTFGTELAKHLRIYIARQTPDADTAKVVAEPKDGPNVVAQPKADPRLLQL